MIARIHFRLVDLGTYYKSAPPAGVEGYECVLASVLMDNLSVAYAAAI